MPKALWNNEIIADSDETVVVEGNHYFPPDTVGDHWLRESAHRTWCGWKGEASYYDVVVGDDINAGAAWYYPDPFPAATQIQGMVAFWKGVKVID